MPSTARAKKQYPAVLANFDIPHEAIHEYDSQSSKSYDKSSNVHHIDLQSVLFPNKHFFSIIKKNNRRKIVIKKSAKLLNIW